MPAIPYVVGQWVRGDRFYGRRSQIEEILEGHRNSIWLLGTRRIGKTSLLKQLEHLADSAPEPRFFPIFWDFQGAEEPSELHLNFADALLDAEERLERIGIDLAQVEAEDLFVSIGRLRRQLRSRSLGLLLLCDEVEELIKLHSRDPSLLRKLRRVMQSHEEIRSVLASTIRLWALADQKEDTSPFLHGFSPPLYIERLSDPEARSLLEQSHLDAADRPGFSDEALRTILDRCDNHPYLLQLVGKRTLETGNADEAIEQVATDRMVSYFFAVDFDMLSETERQIIHFIARRAEVMSDSIRQQLAIGPDSLTGTLHRLEQLGFIRRGRDGRLALSNYFFRHWLEQLAEQDGSSAATAGLSLTAELAPRVIENRYEVLEKVGEGATGIVYLADDRLLKTRIAIKVLRAEYAAAEEAVERFRQEVLLARDIGHPNILRMYHLGVFEGRIYVTMQWVEGPTLAEVIRQQAPLPNETTVAIGSKLASALEAAHARRILHRDIKPQNVLLEAGTEPLVTDFGLARLQGEPSITRSGMFLGTPNYASPEQCQMKPLDERSDIYALGLVLFEMATGRRPFEADTIGEILEMHRSAPPPDPSGIAPEIDPRLGELILRCLEKKPEDRYPSAAALRGALNAIAGQAA